MYSSSTLKHSATKASTMPGKRVSFAFPISEVFDESQNRLRRDCTDPSRLSSALSSLDGMGVGGSALHGELNETQNGLKRDYTNPSRQSSSFSPSDGINLTQNRSKMFSCHTGQSAPTICEKGSLYGIRSQSPVRGPLRVINFTDKDMMEISPTKPRHHARIPVEASNGLQESDNIYPPVSSPQEVYTPFQSCGGIPAESECLADKTPDVPSVTYDSVVSEAENNGTETGFGKPIMLKVHGPGKIYL